MKDCKKTDESHCKDMNENGKTKWQINNVTGSSLKAIKNRRVLICWLKLNQNCQLALSVTCCTNTKPHVVDVIFIHAALNVIIIQTLHCLTLLLIAPSSLSNSTLKSTNYRIYPVSQPNPEAVWLIMWLPERQQLMNACGLLFMPSSLTHWKKIWTLKKVISHGNEAVKSLRSRHRQKVVSSEVIVQDLRHWLKCVSCLICVYCVC